MDKTLQLRVIAAMKDKLSGPLKTIGGRAAASAQGVATLRDRLKTLNSAARDVGRFRDLSRGLQTTRNEMAAAQQRVAGLARQMQASTQPTRAMQREFSQAVKAAQHLKAKHGEQSVELQRLRANLSRAGIGTATLSRDEHGLRQRIEQTNQALSRQVERLKAASIQQQRLAHAKDRYTALRGTAGSMAGMGAGGLAAGGGALYTSARLLAPGVSFDAGMSKVQALARLDKTSKEMQQLRQQARDLGASTSFTAQQAADAQGFLAMSGFNPRSIMATMPGMLSLAKAGDTDLAMAADISSNILTGFKLPAEQMERLGDVLVGAFTNSNTTLSMLGNTMKYAAPVAAGQGVDIETAAAMAGKLGAAGIQSSMAGTAMRAIITRIATSDPDDGALAELSIQARDAQGNLRDIPSILAELHRKTAQLGSAQRAVHFKDIAGEEAFSALQVLVDEAGSGALQEFVAMLRQTEGEAKKVASVMGDNLRGDLNALTSAWQDLGIELETQQDGALRGITRSITGAIGAVKTWTRENPLLSSTLFRSAAVLAVFIAGMGALTLTLASILGPFALVRYALTLFGIKSLALSPILTALGTALRFVGRGVLFIGRALLMNPIGLAITAIAGAAYLIYQYWEPIKTFFTGLWQEVKQAFAGGIGEIATLLLNWSPVGLLYKAIQSGLSALGIELPGKFSEFGGMLMQGLINGITGMAGTVKESISNIGNGVIGWFKDKLGIRSPSRVFIGLGEFVSEGAAEGITRQQPAAVQAARALAASVAIGGAMLPPGPAIAGGSSPDARIARLTDSASARLTARQSAPHPVTIAGDTYHIHVNATGWDEAQLRHVLDDLLRQREHDKAARMRSAMHDYE